MTQQKLIVGISNNRKKEFYIPFHKEFVLKINHKEKQIEVAISKEILDLN